MLGAGRIESNLSALPELDVSNHGPYEGLGGAWGELDAGIAANGHTPAPDLWQCYVMGPDANPDLPAGARSSTDH